MDATAAVILATDRIAGLVADGQRSRLAAEVPTSRPHHHRLSDLPAIARRLGAAVRALPRAIAG